VLILLTVFNAVVGMRQEGKAESAMNALKSMMKATARVRRDGVEAEIRAEQLVVGDVVLMAAGDQVPADGEELLYRPGPDRPNGNWRRGCGVRRGAGQRGRRPGGRRPAGGRRGAGFQRRAGAGPAGELEAAPLPPLMEGHEAFSTDRAPVTKHQAGAWDNVTRDRGPARWRVTNPE
jgi:hypothetical protein